MAAPRLPDSDQSAVTRPVASLVDTFVRPRQPQIEDQTTLVDLTRGFASLSPSLARLAGEGAYQQRLKDTEEGKAAGLRGEATPQDASEFRRRAQEETLGAYRVAPDADTARQAAWNDPANPDRNTTDPAVFQRWLDNFRNERLKGLSPDAQRGFLEANSGYERQALSGFNSQLQQRRDEESMATLQSSMISTIRGVLQRGGSAQDAIQAAHQSSVALQFAGLRGTVVNEAMGNAVLTVAQEGRRTDLIDAVVKTPRQDLRNPGQTIVGLGAGWDVRLTNATLSIRSAQAAEEGRNYARQQQATQTAGVAGIAAETRALMAWQEASAAAAAQGQPAPPPPPIDPANLRAIERYRPDYLLTRHAALEQLQTQGRRQAPSVYLTASQAIRDATVRGEPAQDAYLRVLSEQRVTDPTIINNLQQDARFFQESGQVILSNPIVRGAERQITAVVPALSMDRPQVRLLQSDAQRFFQTGIIGWASVFRRENQRAPTPEEINTKADELGKAASEYVRAWMDAPDTSGASWRPGSDLPLPSPNQGAGRPTGRPGSTPAASQQATPAARVAERTPTAERPPEAPPADPRQAPVGGSITRGFRNLSNYFSNLHERNVSPSTPLRVIHESTGEVLLDGNPIAFPEAAIRHRGASGTGNEIPFDLTRTWTKPQDAQIAALLVGLRRNPNDTALIREFDDRFGSNAALFYVRLYNRGAQSQRNPTE